MHLLIYSIFFYVGFWKINDTLTSCSLSPYQMVTADLVGSSLKLNYCELERAIALLKEQYAVGTVKVKIWRS